MAWLLFRYKCTFSILFIYRKHVKYNKLSQLKSENYDKGYEHILNVSNYMKLGCVKTCSNFSVLFRKYD